MKDITAEFATASFFSAFSTTLIDVGHFKRKGYNASYLQVSSEPPDTACKDWSHS